MEDSDFLCPLCCEELDISDRNFYPCKCGYQVCMWCWHRIRESESGLCPACRTPYGDDPHEFSAVDVEEVLRVNKEKAAAEKKTSIPKETAVVGEDRTALANMRVIRRNLVYAVGLPPLPEEVLRKAEYLGQYGKINKIVLNRNNPPVGDARRASASAYVTFFHKEDTLACILALDGFYMDGRNIRASYGTSKYCSAFIKNVRCNNPECTYLHSMGEKEDTFTKQEIQAGYVTSGRDVLERQHVAGARRKVGGGGPSGTGKASANPIFPPPTYEEPPKPPPMIPAAAPIPPRSGQTAKLSRSNSMAETSPPSSGSAVLPSGRSKSVGLATTTAASVVAGMHAPEPPPVLPPRTTTLTPLTPLKPRSMSKPKLLQDTARKPSNAGSNGSGGGSSVPSKNDDVIGGNIIGGHSLTGGGSLLAGLPSGGSSLLGGDIIGGGLDNGPSRLSAIGGEVFTGDASYNASSAIGGDKWSGQAIRGSRNSLFASSDRGALNGSGGVIGVPSLGGFGAIGAGTIGGSAIGFNDGFSTNSGSSALASMLGINLPTAGSGTLANDSGLFYQNGSSVVGSQRHSGGGTIGPAPRSSTFGSALAPGSGVMSSIGPGAIGVNNVQRGGVIGAPPAARSAPIGTIGGNRTQSSVGSSSSQSDIALLQSLLPGVHITSGHGQQQALSSSSFDAIGPNWNSGQPDSRVDRTWNSNGSGGFQAAPGGGVIGAPKQQQNQQQNRNNIW